MLTPLYDLTQQFQNKNGSILVAGKLFVYYIGRPDLATTWADDGASAVNPNPILLDNNGRAPCFVDDSYSYTLVVCDRNGQELFSQDITPGDAGGAGGRVVYHDETLSGAGTVASLLGVANIPLGVDDTMTAYTGVVDNKDALILGVNGDWFNSMYSGMKGGYVTKEEFSACCSAVKGGLDNKVDLSALDNYYTKYEVNSALSNKVDVNYFIDYTSAMEDRLEHSLVFGYDENSAISSINNSALAGGQGGDTTPWISGAKILADTQTFTDNMIVQVLSSFTLSGNKNHCIAVKGGTYRFPNAYELGDRIATTNFFMANSAMSSYLPVSSFSSYTASIQNSLNSNWDYTNSAYSLSINNFYNKLDVSSFSSWSANLDLSGDYIPTSASGSFYPMVGNPSGFLTQHQDISNLATKNELVDTSSFLSASISSISSFVSGNDDKYYPLTGNPSGFLTAHQSLTDYYKKTETSSKQEISAAIAAIPLGDVEVNNVVHNNSATWDNVVNKLDSTAYHELTAGTNIDIQNYVISSKDWTNEIKEASANAFNEATAQIPAPFDPTYISAQIDNKLNKSESANFYPMTGNPSGFLTAHQSLTGYYLKTETSSREEISAVINELSGKLPDIESVYTLTGGTGVELETDHVNQKTIINVTGQFDNTAVNNVVQTYSANGTWLTAHQSLTNYYTKTDTSSKQELSAALQYVSSNAGKTYTGVSPIVVNNTTNQISADTWSFSAGNGLVFTDDNANKVTKLEVEGESISAGPGINIFSSGGYVVISAEGGGTTFPITGTNGTTGFTANMDCSSMMLTTGASPAGGYVKQTTRGVQYEAYPATDVSASWYNIINATNNRSNCYCIRFTNDMTAASLEDYSAYDKVTVVHSNEYTPNCMLYWDGNTKVFPSGLYCELVKGTNDQNQTDWFFTTSGWINNLEWDWD